MFAFTVAMLALWRWTVTRQDQLTAAWRRRAQRYGMDLGLGSRRKQWRHIHGVGGCRRSR